MKLKTEKYETNGKRVGTLKNIHKIDSLLADLQSKTEKRQISNIKNETKDVTIDATNIKRIKRKYYQQFYTHNLTTSTK